jgi:hypothetical protein
MRTVYSIYEMKSSGNSDRGDRIFNLLDFGEQAPQNVFNTKAKALKYMQDYSYIFTNGEFVIFTSYIFN